MSTLRSCICLLVFQKIKLGYIFYNRKYIVVGAYYAQVIWMKNTLEDYEIHLKNISIKCDNTSAICLTKNFFQHSRTKHIDIRHHFIRDHVNNHDISLEFINTKHQLADI